MTDKTYSSHGYYPEGALRDRAENRLMLKSRSGLADAMEHGTILESTCLMCDCSTMELTVDLPDGIRGIIPREEAAYAYDGSEVKDIAVITRVGKPIQFKVTALSETATGTVAYLSRRAAQKECYERFVLSLVPGDIIPVRVTHLEAFGAFCDIGAGIVSLLSIDRISVSRISHPSDRFGAGAYLSAVVLSFDESGRVLLTHRELLGTWEENASRFEAGQTVTGIIRSVEDYGVFVELAPNLAGLAEAAPFAVPGESCSVFIKSILPDRMKIKLILIDSCGRASPSPFSYFIDPERTWHMDSWRYSPACSRKKIETVFAENEKSAVAT